MAFLSIKEISMKKYDAVIIGFGKAGKTLAAYLANKDKHVAIIEKDKNMYGGTCINVGCIPTKYLVHKSTFAKEFSTFLQKAEYYKKSILEKIEFISKLRGVNYHKLADNQNIEVFTGEGSFLNNHEIEIRSEKETISISGEDIYINTGSTSFIPPIDGLKDNNFVFTSNTLLDLKILPETLLIIGGGNIGLEYANIYSNFGSKVIVLSTDSTFMKREDTEVGEIILDVFKNKNIDVKLGIKIVKIEGNKVIYTLNDKEFVISGDAILVATGRIPNTRGLSLEKANVKTNERGGIIVDKNLRTNIDNIYALGDCNGGLQFTYVSLDDFRIIKSNLEGKNYDLTKRKNVPYSIFIEPSLGRVGLNENEAKQKDLDYKVLRVEMKSHPKAKLLEDDKGFIKVLVDNKSHLILGATLLCEEAFELINYIKLAMDHDIKYEDLVNTIYTHPTMSEAFNDLK